MTITTTPPYYGRSIAAHGSDTASVIMAQEAPGPAEDAAGIPSVGRQGNNFFRRACDVGVPWALNLQSPGFVWPCSAPDSASLARLSEDKRERMSARLAHRHRILEERRRYITFTNAFDRWPKPRLNAIRDVMDPRNDDILSAANKERLRTEIQPQHRILLLGGAYSYLAYTGTELVQPSEREGSRLTETELEFIELHLCIRFEKAWYMGHTRRWHLGEQRALSAFRDIARDAGWMT